jgi:hypothetical protein
MFVCMCVPLYISTNRNRCYEKFLNFVYFVCEFGFFARKSSPTDGLVRKIIIIFHTITLKIHQLEKICNSSFGRAVPKVEQYVNLCEPLRLAMSE